MSGSATMSGSAGAGSPASYELTGDREDELDQYVGQQVEITGTVDRDKATMGVAGSTSEGAGTQTSASGSTAAGSGTSSSTGTAGTSAGHADPNSSHSASGAMPRLKISSFRAVGGSCDATGSAR